MIDGDGEGGGADGNGDVRGEDRHPARSAHATHDQPAEGSVADADEIALVRRGVVVVHAARRVRSVCGDKAAERRRDDRPAAQDRALADDEGCEVVKEAERCIEHVPADIERVGVDAERRVVEELARVTSPDRVLLDEVERPDRAAAESTPALAASETAMSRRFGRSPSVLGEVLGTSMMVRIQRPDKRS